MRSVLDMEDHGSALAYFFAWNCWKLLINHEIIFCDVSLTSFCISFLLELFFLFSPNYADVFGKNNSNYSYHMIYILILLDNSFALCIICIVYLPYQELTVTLPVSTAVI